MKKIIESQDKELELITWLAIFKLWIQDSIKLMDALENRIYKPYPKIKVSGTIGEKDNECFTKKPR